MVIEAEVHQPLGQDDAALPGIGIDLVVAGINQEAVFRRQVLGIQVQGELLLLPLDQQLHRPAHVPALGLHLRVFDVLHKRG